MENSHHDIHQFYFERYLRNKLSADEKRKLEQRLSEDTELRAALEAYRQNRRQLVKELIREHDKGPGKSRISSFIYLAITIAGLVLALNLYLENRALRAERKRDKNLITRLLDNIPFVGRKERPEAAPQPGKETGRNKPVAVTSKTEEPVSGSSEPIEAGPADSLLHDTVLVPISRKYIEQRFTYYRTEIDSMLSDAEILNLIYRNHHKYAEKHRSSPVGIEFRQGRPSGYVFDGNKLVLFGVAAPFRLMLVKDENELVWIRPDAEIIFVADNTFHSY